MEMKDRVENFLKVARERYGDDNEMRRELRYLLDGLANLVHENTDLLITLKAEWTKIEMDYQVSQWDERFLKAVANEKEWEEGVDKTTVRSSFNPPPYPFNTSIGTSGQTLSLGGAGTGATWANTATTTSATATQRELEELKRAFKEWKEKEDEEIK